MPIEPATVAALGLLAAGVVASFLPLVPSGLLSLAGVYVFWWSNGFGTPGVGFVAVTTVLGLGALAADYLGTPLAAGAAGVSTRAAVVAGVVGLLLFPFTGPLGVLAGAAGVVYLAQRRRGTARAESVRTALRTVVGMLVANLVEFLLALAVLVAVLAVVVL
ncbi:DUF456 domain-containing protein [Halobacteriales archaeon QS_1_68_20]|nr:MAG: DUF456 domain-containing protein [Halobacteriales archaeon QS_1_68_20]